MRTIREKEEVLQAKESRRPGQGWAAGVGGAGKWDRGQCGLRRARSGPIFSWFYQISRIFQDKHE